MPRHDKQKKEAKIIQTYFEEGLADAIRDSLKSLFSEPLLPDNPYHYLAAALGAYVDQNALWAETDVGIISVLDSDGGLDVVDGTSKLCRLAASSPVLGLPHVLRTVSKEGAQIVHDVLTNSLPDSVFPGPTPFSSRKQGYTIQLLSSVQGSTVLWHPQWLEFPELSVRCDVVIKGPRLDDALGLLAELLLSDLQELEAVPVYFVEGLRLVEPLGKPTASGKQQARSTGAGGVGAGAAGKSGGAGALWGLADIVSRPDEFRRALSREVLSGKQVIMAAVVMLEAPVDAAHLQEYQARFESCAKLYSFHFWEVPDLAQTSLPAALSRTQAKGSNRREVSHHGSLPYEALFEGYFLDAAAAKAYLALFQASHKSPPYSREILRVNVDHLADLVEADVIGGSTLEAFRRLLLLVLLQDDKVLQKGPLQASMLRSVEELLLSQQPATQTDMLLTTWVNLIRMVNSGAAEIQAVVRELEALMLVLQQWPHRRDACLAQAAAAAAASGGDADVNTTGADGSHAAATLVWLADHNNMEARLVQQLVSLKPRITAATGSGIFSGISIILGRLLAQLPDSVPASAEDCKQVLSTSQHPMMSLRHMLSAATLSLADALLDRCRDVMWALQRFGIRQVDSVMARAALVKDEAEVAPEWVLDVEAVTDAQVRAGAVAERVATEGVMLQYAVDTQLDLCLSSIYEVVTKPPMPLNPYPRLLHILRAHAARLDLFQEDLSDVRHQLMNQLMLLAPPGFIYAAAPPSGTSRRRKRAGAAMLARVGGGGNKGDEAALVFGSYAAVTLCDCRSLQSLSASLGPLLSERQWQQGSYNADVLVALVGDAALSGALCLSKAEELRLQSTMSSRSLGQPTSTAWSPYEHPRFYCIEVEEHHHIEGPELIKAALLFAQGAVDHVLELHHRSQHVVQQVVVDGCGYNLPDLLQANGRQALMSALVAAVSSATARQPQTYADSCVAVVHLLVVVKEGLYVKVLRRLHFNFKCQGLPHNTSNSAAVAAHRQQGFAASRLPVGSADGRRTSLAYSHPHARAAAADCDTTLAAASSSAARQTLHEQDLESCEPHWDLGAYRRVFLTEASAQAWHSWNCSRGDPAQPFHYQHLLRQLLQQVPGLEAAGLLLEVQKLLLVAAVATQDATTICSVSRCMQSAAQELRCLQDVSSALQFLLAEDLPQVHASKLDGERVRRLFLLYCGRLRRALTSPKYCYFSGFAATAPGLIAELREHVLSNNKLDSRRAGIMQQLDMWTQACELSVAASVHESLGSSIGSIFQKLLSSS